MGIFNNGVIFERATEEVLQWDVLITGEVLEKSAYKNWMKSPKYYASTSMAARKVIWKWL